jgi:hypothetical protein
VSPAIARPTCCTAPPRLTGSGSRFFAQGGSEFGHHYRRRLRQRRIRRPAIGGPFENIGGIVYGGAVNVLDGTPAGLTNSGRKHFTQNTPGVRSEVEIFDRFGYALAAGDFDNDGFADLAIGVPFEVITGLVGAGAVHVLYGRAAGLTGSGSQYFTQSTRGVGSTAENGDRFGDALAAGDFDNDGFADLAIGVTAEDIGGIFDGGAVNVLYGRAAGLTGPGSQYFTQNTPE